MFKLNQIFFKKYFFLIFFLSIGLLLLLTTLNTLLMTFNWPLRRSTVLCSRFTVVLRASRPPSASSRRQSFLLSAASLQSLRCRSKILLYGRLIAIIITRPWFYYLPRRMQAQEQEQEHHQPFDGCNLQPLSKFSISDQYSIVQRFERPSTSNSHTHTHTQTNKKYTRKKVN